MRILGNRVLLERIEKEKTSGFEAVEALDQFVSKGRVVQVGEVIGGDAVILSSNVPFEKAFDVGDIVLFAKFSPDTQEVTIEGVDMKVVAVADIIAVL